MNYSILNPMILKKDICNHILNRNKGLHIYMVSEFYIWLVSNKRKMSDFLIQIQKKKNNNR